MKKNLLFLAAVPFVLAGCSSPSVPSEGVTTTWATTNPLDFVSEKVVLSWDVSKELYEKFPSNFSDCTKVDGDSFAGYTCASIQGYKQTYYVPLLGIKKTYNIQDRGAIFAPDFYFSATDTNPLAVAGNKLYATAHSGVSISLIEKTPTQTPEQALQNVMAPAGCKIVKSEWPNSSLVYYGYESDEEGNYCENTETMTYTRYIFSNTNPNYYYEEHYQDECEEGGCNALDQGTIQLFLK